MHGMAHCVRPRSRLARHRLLLWPAGGRVPPLLQKEIEDMIWEVDENLDGCVDWEEFQLMFRRNITDKTGLEPFQLFNVVQFCMYDKDFSGQVSVDETMHMLFARYGKERLEAEMKVRGEGAGAACRRCLAHALACARVCMCLCELHRRRCSATRCTRTATAPSPSWTT